MLSSSCVLNAPFSCSLSSSLAWSFPISRFDDEPLKVSLLVCAC